MVCHSHRTQSFALAPRSLLRASMVSRRLALMALCASLAVASCAAANPSTGKFTAWEMVKSALSPAPPAQRDPVPMRLIGAGLPRTGTLSLKGVKETPADGSGTWSPDAPVGFDWREESLGRHAGMCTPFICRRVFEQKKS